MFWKFTPPSTSIATLLENEDVTLKTLLDDEEILQECKGQNSKLIEFLSKTESIEDMVDMIIKEPEEEVDEASKYKYSNLACEILTSDIAMINNVLGDTDTIREKLFSFLNKEPPFNPLLASFFSKIIGILLTRKPEPTLEYIKNAEEFLSLVLKHIGTSAIMDLLLRMVTCVEEAELRADILKWLNENRLIEKLIERIDPKYDEEIHCNCSQALCDIIRLSREHMYTLQESAQEDPLLSTLEREETVSLLLKHMFDGEVSESVIVNGINVLLALLEIKRPAPFGFPEMVPELTQLDVERLARGVSKILHGLSGRLGDFHKLLEDPPKRESMACTFGELSPPFGNTRLQVCKLLHAILVTNTHNINCQLADLKIFNVLLDLFFKYEFNNFLHTQAMHCIQTVLTNVATVNVTTPPNNAETTENEDNENNSNEEDQTSLENTRIVAPLLAHLFEECQIVSRFIKAWKDNIDHESEAQNHRKGNMGHSIVIVNAIVENTEKGANCKRIKQILSDLPIEEQEAWQKFVGETLSDVNERNSRELGGHNPTSYSSDEDTEINDPQFQTITFNSDSSSLQQAYTEYELQQMTSNFIDQFGFPDDDFTETDNNDKFNKFSNLDFSIGCNTNTPNEQMFGVLCNEKQDTLDIEFETCDGKHDDDWVERPIKFPLSTNVGARQRTESGDSNSSNDSDDFIPPLIISHSDDVMEEVSAQSWKAHFTDEDFANNDSSEDSTPVSSPRDDPFAETKANNHSAGESTMDVEKTDEDASENNENWANFDNLSSVGVNISVHPSSENTASNEQSTTPADARTAAYVVLDNSSSDENVGSPMSISYDNTSDKSDAITENVMDSETSEIDTEIKEVTEENITSVIDVVMKEEPSAIPPPVAAESAEEKVSDQVVNEVAPTSQKDEQVITEDSVKTTDNQPQPSAVDLSEIKRQRIDETNADTKSDEILANEDAEVAVSSTSQEETSSEQSVVKTTETESTVVEAEVLKITSSDDKKSTDEKEASESKDATVNAETNEPIVASITIDSRPDNIVQDNEVTSSEPCKKQSTKQEVESSDAESEIKLNGPV